MAKGPPRIERRTSFRVKPGGAGGAIKAFRLGRDFERLLLFLLEALRNERTGAMLKKESKRSISSPSSSSSLGCPSNPFKEEIPNDDIAPETLPYSYRTICRVPCSD